MIGQQRLKDFEYIPINLQKNAIQAEIDAQPANVIAHRLGDWVFTYHGITDPYAAKAAGLWLVVSAPRGGLSQSDFALFVNGQQVAPQSAPAWSSGTDPVVAGLADGSTMTFSANSLPFELADQNDLRADHGLPPLPDPNTITREQPAVAAPDSPAR
jgi:hypothetical protein